jgi:hypothetical protein
VPILPSTMLYSRLDPQRREIRLLDLRSSSSSFAASTSIVSLDDAPEFWALSYVWGSGARIGIVDGAEVEVTANLHAALRAVGRKFGRVCIWVDALCINQVDDEEKNAQVQLMASIYGQASRVIGWLGPEADGSSLAISMIRRASDVWQRSCGIQLSSLSKGDLGALISHDFPLDWLTDMPQLGVKRDLDTQEGRRVALRMLLQGDWRHAWWTAIPTLHDWGPVSFSPAWRAIGAFFEREYWSRIWILQEYALSSNLVLLCGSETLDPVDTLPILLSVRQCHKLADSGPDTVSGVGEIEGTQTFSGWFKLDCALFFATLRFGKLHTDIIGLVRRANVLAASNPRDRLYALSAFSPDKVAAHYEWTVAQVYTEFAKGLLVGRSLGELLAQTEVNRRVKRDCLPYEQRISALGASDDELHVDHDLPSWVPDWDFGNAVEATTQQSIERNRLPDETASMLSQMRQYQAGPMAGKAPVIHDNQSLVMRGVRIDSVVFSRATRDMLFSSFDGNIGDQTLPSWWRAFNNVNTGAYPTSITNAQALLLATFLGRTVDNDDALNISSPTYAAHARLFACYISRLSEYYTEVTAENYGPIAREIYPQMEREFEDQSLDNDSNLQAQLKAMTHCLTRGWLKSRRLFYTVHGYLGIGPKGMHNDDVVVIFRGCQMPIVLRRVEDGWMFIGLCYLQGWMNEEAYGDSGSSLTEEEFSIC